MKWASLLSGDFHKIPIDWRTDFQNEWSTICYSRFKILVWLSLIYPLIVAPILYYYLSSSEPAYLRILVTILLCIFAISLFTIIKIKGSQNIESLDRIQKSQSKLISFYSLTLTILSDFIFSYSWLRTGINSPYLLWTFIYAFVFYRPKKIESGIYFANFIFYLGFISIFRYSFHPQSIAYFTGFAAVFGAWALASTLYNARVNEFINSRTIQIQSQELDKVNEELRKLVAIDGLTQVANRRRFDQHLSAKYQELTDTSNLGILLCDIDYFKLFNDTYGHQCGDECLRKVAATIQDEIRGNEDLVARYGGEEFVIILCDTSPQQALKVAQRICDQIQNLHIFHERSPIQEVTLSIGVFCQIPTSEYKPEQLISKADQALYEAKSKGRNQAVYAS